MQRSRIVMEEQFNIKNRMRSVGKKIKRYLKKLFFLSLIISLIIAIALFFFWNINYSEGYKSGILDKISKKGYIFKTYEGILLIPNQNDLINNNSKFDRLWEFSVDSEAIYKKLLNYKGSQINVKYKEKVKAMPWQGDSKFIVIGVEPMTP